MGLIRYICGEKGLYDMRLPAEWEKQSGIQLTWPDETTPWYELPKVQECYARIAAAVQRHERLMMVTADAGACLARLGEIAAEKGLSIDLDAIMLAEVPINDTWARDHGPIACYSDSGEKLLYDFVFNGWGLKFASDLDNQISRAAFLGGAFAPDVQMVDMRPYVLEGGSIDTDGAGTLLTTRECLCSLNRNEYLTQEEIEAELTGAFGLKRILWLESGAIDGDDTDSHVDILARFCSPETIAYTASDNPDYPCHDALKAMEKQLQSFRTLSGKPYRLIPLPLPQQQWLDGYPLPASYTNFLILNGAVLMPAAGDPMDEVARERLQTAFPDRKVELIDCRALLSGHGGLHCVTMNFPEGYLP